VVAKSVIDGWQFAHLLSFFSGIPYTPAFTIQQANTGTAVNIQNIILGTPDLTPRSTVNGSLSATNSTQFFNPSNLGVPGIFPASNGTGNRNYLTAPGTFVNDMSISKRFYIKETKSLELRVSAYNAFNQVRRVNLNTSVQYKANGPAFANGFTVYNTPDQLAQRAVASGLNSLAVFNQYRTGVGYTNLTMTQPMRIVELGLKFRF
jgi:hypothetical protein